MKNMLNIKEIEVGDKVYEFRLTYKAKVEIDRITRQQMKSFADEDVIKAFPYFSKLDDTTLSEEERLEALSKVVPLLEKEESINSGIDPFELGYILLHSIPEYYELTKQEYYDEIIVEIENQLGFEKMYDEFTDLYNEVFTRVERMNKKTSVVPRQKTQLPS